MYLYSYSKIGLNWFTEIPKITANLYCICLSIPQIYNLADTEQICGKFLETQYLHQFKPVSKFELMV